MAEGQINETMPYILLRDFIGIDVLSPEDTSEISITVIDEFGSDSKNYMKFNPYNSDFHGKAVTSVLLEGNVDINALSTIEIHKQTIRTNKEELFARLANFLQALEELDKIAPIPQIVNFSMFVPLTNPYGITEVAIGESRRISKEGSVTEKILLGMGLINNQSIFKNINKSIQKLEIAIVEKMLKLRSKGLIFISPLPNSTRGYFFGNKYVYSNPLIHSQCITVSGVTNSLDKTSFEVIGYSNVPPDVYGISYWEINGEHFEGNSFASPMIAIAVAMILKRNPSELNIDLPPNIPLIEKAALRQRRIVNILNKNTSIINTTNLGKINCLDFKKLKYHLAQNP